MCKENIVFRVCLFVFSHPFSIFNTKRYNNRNYLSRTKKRFIFTSYNLGAIGIILKFNEVEPRHKSQSSPFYFSQC